MTDKTTTYSLHGKLKVAVQDLTEPIDLRKLLNKPTTFVIEGKGFTATINLCSPSDICIIDLKIREEI